MKTMQFGRRIDALTFAFLKNQDAVFFNSRLRNLPAAVWDTHHIKTSEMEQKTYLTAGRNRFLLGIITVTFSTKHNLFVLHYLISVYFCIYIILSS